MYKLKKISSLSILVAYHMIKVLISGLKIITTFDCLKPRA